MRRAIQPKARKFSASRSLLYPQIVFALVAGMLNVPLDLLGRWALGQASQTIVLYLKFHLISAGIFAAITFCLWRWIVPLVRGVWMLRILVQTMLGIVLFGYGLVAALYIWLRLAHAPAGAADIFAHSPALANLIVICGATLYMILGGLALDGASQEQRRLRELALTAQLEALRSQLNHHFLFNSLNVIAEAAAVEPQRAEKLILQLAGVLRYSMGKSRARMAPLSDELAAVASYLELERARSGDRISIHTEIAPDVSGLHVPPLLIQPLVENAVSHGLLNGTCAGTISIAAWRGSDRLYIRVEDNGIGFQPDRGAAKGERGLGLSNLRERLRAFYVEQAEFHLHSFVGGGTIAEISLPLINRDDSVRRRHGIVWDLFFGYLGSVGALAAFAIGLLPLALSAASSLLLAQVIELLYLLAASAAEETKIFDVAVLIFLFAGQVAYISGFIDWFVLYAPALMLSAAAAVAILPQLFGGEPFTSFWMRRAYASWMQKAPSFARISRHLAAAWAIAFAALAAVSVRAPSDVYRLAIISAIVIGAVLLPLSMAYPAYYFRRIGLRGESAETFILGLPFLFDRNRAASINISVQFVVSGSEPGSYYVEIRDRQCIASQGDLREPDLTIYCTTESFSLVARGELTPEQAARETLIRYSGGADQFRDFFGCFRLAVSPHPQALRRESDHGLRAAAS